MEIKVYNWESEADDFCDVYNFNGEEGEETLTLLAYRGTLDENEKKRFYPDSTLHTFYVILLS